MVSVLSRARVCPGLSALCPPHSQTTQAVLPGAPLALPLDPPSLVDPLSLPLPHSPLWTYSPPNPCPGLFQNLSAYNTRLFKEVDQDGKPHYEVRLASVLGTGEPLLLPPQCSWTRGEGAGMEGRG